MISVNVNCLTASKYPNSKFSTELQNGSTIDMLISKIGINENEALTFLVNGEKQDLTYVLHNNDNISIVPQILGG